MDHCRWCGTEVEISKEVDDVIRRGAIVLVYCSDKCRQECEDYNDKLRRESGEDNAVLFPSEARLQRRRKKALLRGMPHPRLAGPVPS
jgi:hypothetical protein